VVTSKKRKQRYMQEKGAPAAPERPLKAVPQAEPEPAPQADPPADEGALDLDMDLDFSMPPMDLLYAEGAIPHSPPKTVVLGPALEAHWRKFVMANPDMKMLSDFVRAAVRVAVREWEASAEKAREEMRRVGVPVRPEAGPILRALRSEVRMVKSEKAEERAEMRKAAREDD
jgi:hypothetical protein